jgi:hypothetical protein
MSVEQVIRAGGTPLTATITTSAPGVAQLVTTAQTGATGTVQIPVGQARSPSTVATDGIALDPLTVGTTTVAATIPGLIAVTAASVSVTVATPFINLSATNVGAGLQTNTSGSLGAPVPAAGLTIHIASANPSVALVSPNATTPGSASIDIVLNAGATSFPFYVQGVEGTTGIINVTATAPAYANGSTTATIVQPALDIILLGASQLVSAADDPFQVRIGTPNATNQTLAAEQELRAGSAGLTATVTSSNPAVATLVTTPLTAGTVTVLVTAGQSRSAATVVTGGVALDLLTTGSTTVAGTIPGFIAVTAATLVVTVNP